MLMIPTPNGRVMPCETQELLCRFADSNWEPDIADTLLTIVDRTGAVHKDGVRIQNVKRFGMELGTYCTGYIPHWATCPRASAHRRRQKTK